MLDMQDAIVHTSNILLPCVTLTI